MDHLSRPAVVAAIAAAGWLAVALAVLWTFGADAVPWLAAAAALTLPPLMLWSVLLLARRAAALEDEAERLRDAAQALAEAARSAARPPSRAAAPTAPEPRPERPRPPSPPPAQSARMASARPEAPSEHRQRDLPLVGEDAAPAVSTLDLARALDFPESAADAEGFRALKVALRNPRTRRLVQASQDVLTLLSEDGIYMDDIAPEIARPEAWRRFASGERGPAVAVVGGVHDRSILATSAARMRQDPVFRDAAHHFLRLFDQSLAEIAPRVDDAELAALAQTRTARAFMLIGRVAGIFQ